MVVCAQSMCCVARRLTASVRPFTQKAQKMRNIHGDVGPECFLSSAVRQHQNAALCSSYGLVFDAMTLRSEEQRGRARLASDTTAPPCRQEREAAPSEGRRETLRLEAVAAPEVSGWSRTIAFAGTAGAPRGASWFMARLRRPTPHPTRVHTMDVSHHVGHGTVIRNHVTQQQDRAGNNAHDAASLVRSHPCALLRKFLVETHPQAQDHHAVHHARSNNRLHLTIGMAGEAGR